MPSCHSSCGILSWLLLMYSDMQLSLHWTKKYAAAVRQHVIATQWPCLIPHPVCLHRSIRIEEILCSILIHSSFLAIWVCYAVKLCFVRRTLRYVFLHWASAPIVAILYILICVFLSQTFLKYMECCLSCFQRGEVTLLCLSTVS